LREPEEFFVLFDVFEALAFVFVVVGHGGMGQIDGGI
jgi:hypothetical protein